MFCSLNFLHCSQESGQTECDLVDLYHGNGRNSRIGICCTASVCFTYEATRFSSQVELRTFPCFFSSTSVSSSRLRVFLLCRIWRQTRSAHFIARQVSSSPQVNDFSAANIHFSCFPLVATCFPPPFVT